MNFLRNRFFNGFLEVIIRFIDFILLKYDLQILNILKKVLLSFKAKVVFIVEGGNWSIFWDGKYITENLKKLGLVNTEIASPLLAKNKIIHWGSISCLIGDKGLIYLDKSNKNIVTWFHVVPSDKRLKFVPYLNKKIDILHTSNIITKKKLVESGFNEDKIVVISLGVDLSIFKKYSNRNKIQLRKKFKLPKEKIIIGSFQKDGVGWGEGLEPKLVKGPDIFCEVVKKIRDNFDIHIFLTGPARGYIKKRLEEYQIPYTHIFLENYLDIVECYNALDLYIVTSRSEGGPKALLEAMATGVPIITTKVGMASNLIKHEVNGFIADVDDIDQLYQYSVKILKNRKLREKIVTNGLKIIQRYSWENIATQYYNKIYKKLINN